MAVWTDRVGTAAILSMGTAILLATPASAQTFPKFTGLVVDAANVLPADVEQSLTVKLTDLQKRTGRQLVVATVPDTQGYPLPDYGYRLGRQWGVGLKTIDNGAILLLAPGNPAGQRGPRIEVGYGLEPVLTDALASVIITQQMMPKLPGDVPGAIVAGTDAVIAQLAAPDAEARARVAKAAADYDRSHRRTASTDDEGVPTAMIFWGLVLAFVLFGMIRQRTGGGRRHGGGLLPVILWGSGGGWGSSGGFASGGGIGGGSGSDGGWMGGGFTGGGGGSFGGGGASGSW